MNLANALSSIVAFIAIVGAAAGAFGSIAFFRAKRLQAIIELGEIEQRALKESNARLTKDNVDLKARVTALEQERSVLTAVVTQKDAIELLAASLNAHHAETVGLLRQLVDK